MHNAPWLWERFHGLHRLEPLLQNYHDNGHTWKKHNINAEKVFKLNSQMEMGSKAILDFAKSLLEESIQKGYLENKKNQRARRD